jgi:hypothetical protein
LPDGLCQAGQINPEKEFGLNLLVVFWLLPEKILMRLKAAGMPPIGASF